MIVKLPTRTAGRTAVVLTSQSMLGKCIVMRTPLNMSGVGEAALLLPTSLGGASAAMFGSQEDRILAAIGHRGVLQQRTRGATGSPILGNKTGAGKVLGESNETIEKMPKVAAEATGVAKATTETEGPQPGTATVNGMETDGEEIEETATTKEADGTAPGRTTEIFTVGSPDPETFEQCQARSGNDEDRDYFQYETNAEPGTKEEARMDASAASGKRRRRTLEEAPGLVLYQSLGGKAWIAAEELSVSRLGEENGIEYLISWIRARFLDLEVARIGRAFSDYFRKMRRRPGQTIRDYNAEYDRLFGRLREVGCNLPQEAAAWVYLDRLQLDEAQELNILASVGNRYDLLRLQQAAVLHDRGQRKPWEGAGSRGNKKPHYAHVTDYDDGDGSEGGSDDVGEEGIPEEVAEAWVTYQSAKEKYKNQKQSRGYNGDHERPSRPPPGDGARDRAEDRDRDQGREARLKAMKAKREPGGAKGTSAPKEVAMMTVTVAGSQWLQAYTDLLQDHGQIENIITEEDYVRGYHGRATNYATHDAHNEYHAPESEESMHYAGANLYKKFGEGDFDWGDYSFENCEKILEATHYFPEKLNLRKIHDGGNDFTENK
ncbi:unnamed protein product, partial [Symbiodinium necroappetens]